MQYSYFLNTMSEDVLELEDSFILVVTESSDGFRMYSLLLPEDAENDYTDQHSSALEADGWSYL